MALTSHLLGMYNTNITAKNSPAQGMLVLRGDDVRLRMILRQLSMVHQWLSTDLSVKTC
jgi:hypothetical protein